MKKPIIFLRVAWMQFYKGVNEFDIPNGAGWYVAENQDGGEVLNFKPINGKFYGFARIKNGHNLNIDRLGAKKNDDFIDSVTIILFATDSMLGGQYIVGWYDNARLYRKVQENFNKRTPHPYYMTVSSVSDSVLLPLKYRKFEVPSNGPGQTNAWYVNDYSNQISFLKDFFKFKIDPESYLRKRRNPTNGKGWLLDAEKRKKIENAAMDATFEYFEGKGFTVKYVHRENLGWDMEASKGKVEFKLEVKGTHKDLDSVLLTPNEFHHSKSHKNYRICILESALDNKNSKLHICQLDNTYRYWFSDTGKSLFVQEIMSAKLQLVK